MSGSHGSSAAQQFTQLNLQSQIIAQQRNRLKELAAEELGLL
jgi:hypothetical protein